MSAMLVVAVNVPDVPVMVRFEVPAVAVLLAVRVSTLAPVVGLVPNDAVTPAGSPAMASVTLPVNPPVPVTEILSVMAVPWVTASVAVAGASVKPGACVALTVSVTLVLAVSAPDVPVILMLEVPVAAVLLAAKVSTLAPVVGLVPNEAVTPVGSPDAVSVTLPLNPPAPVTVTVSVALLPRVTARVETAGASVKLGLPVPGMVNAIVTEWLIVPFVPVIVTVLVPAAVPD